MKRRELFYTISGLLAAAAVPFRAKAEAPKPSLPGEDFRYFVSLHAPETIEFTTNRGIEVGQFVNMDTPFIKGKFVVREIHSSSREIPMKRVVCEQERCKMEDIILARDFSPIADDIDRFALSNYANTEDL